MKTKVSHKSTESRSSHKENRANSLKLRKDALLRGEKTPSRVFRIIEQSNRKIARVPLNAESQRRKSAAAWKSLPEATKARHTLGLTQETFAELLGVGINTLRSWEQNKRQPSGAARMLIAIALKHPEVLEEAVA
jgi:DNA-binding transcriptional regulator YiaG